MRSLAVIVLALLAGAGCSRAEPGEGAGMIVFVGDSITAGGDWDRLLDRRDVVNTGKPGDQTGDILRRLDGVVRGDARAYVVMAGINDLAWGVPAEKIAENMGVLLARLRAASPGATLVLQSTLPVNPQVESFGYTNNDVRRLNDLYRALAQEAGVRFLDLHPAMADAEGNLRREFTHDGLHLGGDGYRAWAAALREAAVLP